MPNFNITGPDGHNYSFSAPEGTSQVDALKFADLLYQQRKASLQTAGMGEAFKGGAKRMLGSLETGVSGIFGAEEAAKEGQARQEAITEKSGASLAKVKDVYNQKGFFPAAREVISQIPSAIAEQAPQLATALGGARLGATAGSFFGPAGAIVGGLGGAFLPSLVQQAGTNLERQAQEGKPISGGAAYGAAVPQAALDVFTDKLLFGRLMGIPAAKLGTEAANNVVAKSIKRTLAEGTAKGIVAEVPTEVAQQMLERYQAGLSLTDDEARKEYADTAYQTALLGPLGAIGKFQERGEAKQVVAEDQAAQARAAQQAQAQAQRRATGTMDQQPLFTEEEAPTPAGPMPPEGFRPPEQAESTIPEPSTSIPDVEVPTQGELFTPRGKPSSDALASVEAARLQGLPAKIQELMQTPEGIAELSANRKMYFPDLDVKERNKTIQAIQQGTYGVEPVAPAEGTLTPEILKTFGITPRSKQYKALAGGNLADPTTYNYLTTIAGTNSDAGVKANRILEAFPQYNPNAVQPDLFGVPNAPQTQQTAEPIQPDLFGVQPNGVPNPTEQQGTEQGVGMPVQPAETTPEEAPEPIGPRVDGDSGLPQPNVGAVGPSTAGQPSALAPVPKKVARDAAVELKKMPITELWDDFETGIVFGKLSKIGKDRVRDAVAGNFLTQDLADEIVRIEKGNVRTTAAGKAITPETPLDETPTQAPTAPAPVVEPIAKKEEPKEYEENPALRGNFPKENRIPEDLMSKIANLYAVYKNFDRMDYLSRTDPNFKNPYKSQGAIKAQQTVAYNKFSKLLWGTTREFYPEYFTKGGSDYTGITSHIESLATQPTYKEFFLNKFKEPAPAPVATKKEPVKYAQPKKNMTEAEELEFVERHIDGKNVHEVIDFVIQTAPNKSYRIIAKSVASMLNRLEAAGVKFSFQVHHSGDMVPASLIGARGLTHGRYEKDDNFTAVHIHGADISGYEGTSYRTVLHELIHAATMSAVRLGNRRGARGTKLHADVQELYTTFNKIIDHFKNRIALSKEGKITLLPIEQAYLERRNNAFLDPDEMITWGLTSDEFQSYLDAIPTGNKKTLWSEFVTKIRTLLGIPANSESMLSEVLKQSENILNADVSEMQQVAKGIDTMLEVNTPAQTETPAFKKWFGDSKVVDKEGNPLVVYRGTYTNNEGALNAEAREGYAAFGSDNPYVSNTYANPDATFGGEGSVLPLYIKADKLIEFPVTVSRFDPNLRMFDKFEFDRRAQRLQPGEVLVARQVNDIGPRANLSVDPDRKFAKYSDVYAWNKGTSVKSAIGNKGTFNPVDERITHQIDVQAQAQAQQFIAGMSGTLARSVPTQTTTPAQAAQNFVATVYRNPTDALGMIEGMANRIRTSAIDKAAHLSASIQDHMDGAFYDVNGQMRADLKLSAANNQNNYINAVFTFGDIDILPNGAIEVKQGTHSVDNIFRHAKTLADRIGVEQMRKLVTDSFYHYRAKAIIDNISPDKWPENWQKDPRMVPTQAQINAAMAAFNTFPELRAMQNEFIGSKNQMVKFLRKAGFLTAEKARAFLADDSYAPWLRLKEYQDTIPGLGNIGKMVDLSQMKALVGGTEEVNDMLENMSQMIGWCVRSGISNHTANSALDTMSSMGTAVRHAGRPGSGNPAHVVMTYTDGKPTFWTVENPYDLAAFQSVKGLNSPVMRAIGKGLGTLRAGIVLFPAFPLRQVVMDSQRAFVEAGVKNPWSMVGKIYSSFLSGEAFRGQHQDIQKLMQHGVVGGADFTAMDTTRGRANQFGIGEKAETITDKWVRSPAYNFLHKLAYSADLAVRLGIYRQTLEETGDETLAATKAREIINFQKAGTSELMHTLKQTIPFLGAYLQGMDVNYKGMVGRGNSMQARKAAAKAYWGNMAMYAGLTIAYTMAMSGDDDYEDQKGYVTDHNFLIPGGGLLPIPPDVGFLAKVVPERITDYILQEGTDSPESARRLRQGLLQSFAAGYMPPAAVYGVTPAIELMLNKSFFSDMPIVSQRMQGLDPRFQYTASTSEIAKEIGDITGQSPLQIDYLFNAIGGTSAGALLQLADVAFGSGKMAPDKTPIIGSFQQKTVGGRNAEEYYALREMSDRAYNTVQALALEQNPEKLQAYLADPKKQQLYAMHQGIESLHAQLNQVSRIRNIIEKDPNLSPEEKRQKVNELLANVEATLRAMPIRKQRAELE